MITEIAYQLIKDLSTKIYFIDKWAGLVMPMRKVTDKIEKIIPVAVRQHTVCDLSDHLDLLPDSAKKSVIYGEKITEPTFEPLTKNLWLANADMRIVIWYNLNRITEGVYVEEGVIAANVLAQLPKRLSDTLFDYVSKVMITPIGITTGSEIFSKYTYDEKRTQFMTFPYGAIAINVNVQYVVNMCSEMLIPMPACGQPDYVPPTPQESVSFDSEEITFDNIEITFDTI